MSDRVRIALDIDVDQGSPEKVAEALFEHRAQLAEFASAVILVNNEETADFRTTVVGGNSHVHPDDRDDLPCDECRRYAGRTSLTRVKG